MALPLKKKASHVGAGLAAGAILGLAAGLFLQSRKGKELTKDAEKKAKMLQKQVMKKLEAAGEMSKEKYTEMVDQVVEFYQKSKDVAVKEAPQVRKYLLGRWNEVKGYLDKE
ncbi:YtxH domain-containing protein [Patescibacteria group bacterium]|jgi:gas vesicle protein|nr:YtxH domain-containing protein [Patescibacteria group bacterium]